MKSSAAGVMIVVFLIAGCTAPTHWTLRSGERAVLYLRAPDAGEVLFVSSQNGFLPRKSNRQKDGVWVTEVEANGEFTYFYLIDGRPHTPDCDLTENDDFGSRNCVFSP